MKKAAYYLVMLALSLLGLWALAIRLLEGMAVTALTSYISWGLWVAIYIYFIGLSAGSFLLSTMIYVFGMHQLERVGRMALLTALFSLGAGLLFIWLDLGHPERFWEIFAYPHFTSMMTIESWLYLLYMLLILSELWLLFRTDLAALRSTSMGWRRPVYRLLALGHRPPSDPERRLAHEVRTRRWLTVLGVVGIPTAIGVHGGTGAIFAVAIARPYWNGALFPIVFLVSALASGAGLVTLLYAALAPRDAEFPQVLRRVASLTVLFIGIDLLLVLSEVLVGLYGGVPSHVEVFSAIFEGPYAFVFWLGQLGLAGVIPVAAVFAASARHAAPVDLPVPAPAAPPARSQRLLQLALARLAAAARAQGTVPVAPPARGRALRQPAAVSLVIAPLVIAGDALIVWSRSAPTFTSVTGLGWPAVSTIGFWLAQLVLLTCVTIVVSERLGTPRFWLGVVGGSTVVGILAVRLNIVIPGFVVPVLEHLERAYADSRLHYAYFPSALEWASTVGLIALIVLVFSLAYEILPIYGLKEGAR